MFKRQPPPPKKKDNSNQKGGTREAREKVPGAEARDAPRASLS